MSALRFCDHWKLIIFQTLLRFNLQPCSLAKPFDEMVVGFYVHDNMNFVVTERQEELAKDSTPYQEHFDAGAIAGAYDE